MVVVRIFILITLATCVHKGLILKFNKYINIPKRLILSNHSLSKKPKSPENITQNPAPHIIAIVPTVRRKIVLSMKILLLTCGSAFPIKLQIRTKGVFEKDSIRSVKQLVRITNFNKKEI